MTGGIISDSRTLRESGSETVGPPRELEVTRSAREGTARRGVNMRIRDLEARVELLENALEIDRLHVDTIRNNVQELQIRTTSLVDEISILDAPRTEESATPQSKVKEYKEGTSGEFDGLFLAFICFAVWITIGFKVIYAD